MNQELRIMNYELRVGLLTLMLLLLALGFGILAAPPAMAQVSSCRSGQTICPQGCVRGVNCQSCWSLPTCTITGQTAAVCGSCQCPSGQVVCSGACQANQAGQDCSVDGLPGTTNSCGVCIADQRPPVRLSPYGIETDDATRPSVWINKTADGNLLQLQADGNNRLIVEQGGNLRLIGAERGGDLYLDSGKSIRVDGAGVTELNLGNWGAGADGIALNVLGTLTVGVATFPRDLTLHGNLILPPAGATVDGVNLDNVVLATETYDDPAWLTGLAWNKIDGFPGQTCTAGQFITAVNPDGTAVCVAPPEAGIAEETDPIYDAWFNPVGRNWISITDRELRVARRIWAQSTGDAFDTAGLVVSGPENTNAAIILGQNNVVNWRLVNRERTGTFSVATGGAGTERLSVTTQGNVGIGTSTPAARLDVAGSIRLSPATGDANLFFNVNNQNPWIIRVFGEGSNFHLTRRVGGTSFTALSVNYTTGVTSIGGVLDVLGNLQTRGNLLLPALGATVDGVDLDTVLTGLTAGEGITISGTGHDRAISVNPSLANLSVGNLVVTGEFNAETLDLAADFSANGNATIGGDLTVDGALTIGGAAVLTNASTVNWSQLGAFPAACPPGQFVSAVGGTLTCVAPPEAGIAEETDPIYDAWFNPVGRNWISITDRELRVARRIWAQSTGDAFDTAGLVVSGPENTNAAIILGQNNVVNWRLVNRERTGTFSVATGGAGTERLSVTTQGNVGIGTITPAARLDVTGNLRVSGNIILSTAGATVDGVDLDTALTGLTAGEGITISGTGRTRTVALSGEVVSASDIADVVRDADILDVVRTSALADVVRTADIADVLRSTETYDDPEWLTGLAWNKIDGFPGQTCTAGQFITAVNPDGTAVCAPLPEVEIPDEEDPIHTSWLANPTLSAPLSITQNQETALRATNSNGAVAIRLDGRNSSNQIQNGRLVLGHFTAAEEPLYTFGATATSGANVVHFGGGSSIYNTATRLSFYTAPNNTTLGRGQDPDPLERVRITGNNTETHLTVRASETGLADLIFGNHGNQDTNRWALALRSFEEGRNLQILRTLPNNTWSSALTVSYNTGAVSVAPGVYNNTAPQLQIGDAGYGLSAAGGRLNLWGSSDGFSFFTNTAGSNAERIQFTPTGNIILRTAGATVDGVDLDTVLTRPIDNFCRVNQALSWDGEVLSCVDVAVSSSGTPCTGSQILQRSEDGASWTCAELPEAAVYTAGPNIEISADDEISVVASPEFNGLTVLGGLNTGTIIGNYLPTSGVECAANQVLQWTGSAWICATLPIVPRTGRNIELSADNAFQVVASPTFENLTVTGDVAVGGDLRATGTLDALSLFVTEDVTGRDLIASRDVRVDGDIYANSGESIIVQNPADGLERYFTVESTNEGSGYMHFRVAGPSDVGDPLHIAEYLLAHAGSDRWSLSLRAGTSNFEIWRNNADEWSQALAIDYSSGSVTFPQVINGLNGLNIDGAVSLNGSVSVGQNLTAARILAVGSNNYVNDTGSSLIRAAARYDSLDQPEEYLLNLVTASDAGVPISRFNVNRDGNVTLRGDLNVNRDLSVTGSIRGNFRGNSVFTVGNDTGNISSRTGGGVVRLRVLDGGASMGLDHANIQTSAGDLILQRYGGGVHAYGALDVDGTITAGTQNVPITSAGGGLKMAELANEDWDEEDEGWLPVYRRLGQACTTVCSNHGLVCRIAFTFIETSASEYTLDNASCGATNSVALCMCGG